MTEEYNIEERSKDVKPEDVSTDKAEKAGNGTIPATEEPSHSDEEVHLPDQEGDVERHPHAGEGQALLRSFLTPCVYRCRVLRRNARRGNPQRQGPAAQFARGH